MIVDRNHAAICETARARAESEWLKVTSPPPDTGAGFDFQLQSGVGSRKRERHGDGNRLGLLNRYCSLENGACEVCRSDMPTVSLDEPLDCLYLCDRCILRCYKAPLQDERFVSINPSPRSG